MTFDHRPIHSQSTERKPIVDDVVLPVAQCRLTATGIGTVIQYLLSPPCRSQNNENVVQRTNRGRKKRHLYRKQDGKTNEQWPDQQSTDRPFHPIYYNRNLT